MKERSPERLRFVKWARVFIWVGLIYSTLYIVRPITDFLIKHTQFSLLVNTGIILTLAVVVMVGFLNVRPKRFSSYILLFGILTIYAVGMIKITIPAERIHFLQYGLLGFFVYRALILDFHVGATFVLGIILVTLFGWGDEGIQHLLPNRYYQLTDVMLNTFSGAMGMLLTFNFDREMVQ